MTTLLDRQDASTSVSPAQWLRETAAAVRVSFTWFGVRKALTNEQKNQAAEPFGAEGDYLSARKKLLDTKHAAYKEVTGVRGKVSAYWRSITLPFPEAGVRLIRQHEIQGFNQQMWDYRAELEAAVVKLDEHYSELKSAARRRLGNLFDVNDYPNSLLGLFNLAWDFPNVEPPDYLHQLNPAIYEQERTRVAARFEEAVQLAEQAFISEFAKLIEHLTERLSDTGERKIFRDSAITNLTEFFERFRQLNVRSNADLDLLVERAQQIVSGVEPQALRDNSTLRQHVATQFSQVQSVIDGMLVDRPRRRIIRNQEEVHVLKAPMMLTVDLGGTVHCIYDEVIDLFLLGAVSISRASHVEPDDEGRWWADLQPVAGPVLGPFKVRSEALDAERVWLETHRLQSAKSN